MVRHGVEQGPPLSRFDAVAGALLFLVLCVLTTGGPLDSVPYGDVHLYAHYAHEMASGRWPYRDFFDEYPPFAQPLFYVIHLLPGSYAAAFKWTMAVFCAAALVLLVATLSSLGASRRRTMLAAQAFAVTPIVAGPYFLNAYDLWPALLVSAALFAFLRGRERWAYVLLALAIAAKIYPLVLVPIVLVETWRRGGRDAVRRAVGWLVGAFFVVNLPFLATGAGGLRFSYWVQLKRGLEVHSLGGSLLRATHLGVLRVQPPGSTNVTGGVASAVAVITSLVAVAAVLYVAWLALRRQPQVLLACAAAVVGFLAFDKVFSAQYVDWVVPLVPAAGAVASVAMLLILGLTRIVFGTEGGRVAVLVARDVLVVALYGWIVVRLRRNPTASDT